MTWPKLVSPVSNHLPDFTECSSRTEHSVVESSHLSLTVLLALDILFSLPRKPVSHRYALAWIIPTLPLNPSLDAPSSRKQVLSLSY